MDSLKRLLNFIIYFILFFICAALINTIIISIFHIKNETIMSYIQLIVFFILDIVIIITNKKDFKESLKSIKNIKFLKYLLILIIGFISVVIINKLLLSFLGRLSLNEEENRLIFNINPLFSILSTIIVAPIYEEVLFRFNTKGIIKNKWLYIIFTGLLFGLFHLIGIENFLELFYLIPYSIMGIIISYIYFDSKYNIIASIIFHSFNNLLMVILLLLGVNI